MKKKLFVFGMMLAIAASATGVIACSSDSDNDTPPEGTEEVVPGSNHKVLVAYFSEPLPDGVDASTSASRLVVNGNVVGSVEYLALQIQQNTGADLVRIQTAAPYPGNFDDLAAQAQQEVRNNVHPQLSTNIENFDDYDVIFVGYPIWWYQMPMAMYSFFDKYDFKGKTLVPFSSHGGSGWSGSLDMIRGLEPEATMVEGFSVSRTQSANSAESIRTWLGRINMLGDKK